MSVNKQFTRIFYQLMAFFIAMLSHGVFNFGELKTNNLSTLLVLCVKILADPESFLFCLILCCMYFFKPCVCVSVGICLFVRVTADTHMPQHPCVATRGQARVSVLAFHLLFVVGCCARQAGWPRGSRTSACLPVSPQEGWMTKHPSLCGSGYLN